jgi:hypothetical protein
MENSRSRASLRAGTIAEYASRLIDDAVGLARARERSSIAVYWPRCGQNRQT